MGSFGGGRGLYTSKNAEVAAAVDNVTIRHIGVLTRFLDVLTRFRKGRFMPDGTAIGLRYSSTVYASFTPK